MSDSQNEYKMVNPYQNNMTIMKVGANVLFYWGIISTVLIIIGAFADEDNSFTTSLVIGTFFVGILPLLLGIYLKKKVKLKSKMHQDKISKSTYDEIERKILLAARKKNGVLTLTQASLSIGTNLIKTKELMNKLVSNGFCQIDSDDNGVLIYIFPEFQKDE